MKVYLVIVGDDSNRRVIAVVSEKTRAESLQKVADDLNAIEEFELDVGPGYPPDMLPFSVNLNKDGSLLGCIKISGHEMEERVSVPTSWNRLGKVDDKYFSCQVWAIDKDHAIRCAIEKMKIVIAKGEL